jgi:hypothetical protein
MGRERQKRKWNRKKRAKKGRIRRQVDEIERINVEDDMGRRMRKKGEIGRQ